MDQAPYKILQFDRFALDLSRGCLRIAEQEIDLRPKAFDALRYLAENAGRLVLKKELHEAVWPNVTVTDDSLVHCIRELRQKLGDDGHLLIKTVPCRGYLLDAALMTPAPQSLSVKLPVESTELPARNAISLREFKPPSPASFAVGELFSESDAMRAATIAQSKQLPLPTFQIDIPDEDVPEDIRRFVGIWVSSKGFMNTNRQFMLIITHVEKQGLVGGYTVRGPPAPNSRIQNPAEAVRFTAFISDNLLTYSNPRGEYKVWFVGQDALVFKQTYPSGYMTMVALDPIWTLTEAERVAISKPLAR